MEKKTTEEKTKKQERSYFADSTVSCACGNTFRVGSTRPEIKIDVCSACHPFYTGEGRLVDTRGRVERFKKLVERSEDKKQWTR